VSLMGGFTRACLVVRDGKEGEGGGGKSGEEEGVKVTKVD